MPPNFAGTWKMKSSENFDELLKALGNISFHLFSWAPGGHISRLDSALGEMLSCYRLIILDVVKVGHVAVKVNWGLCVWYVHCRDLFNCNVWKDLADVLGIVFYLFVCSLHRTHYGGNNCVHFSRHLILRLVHLGINFVSKQCNNFLF